MINTLNVEYESFLSLTKNSIVISLITSHFNLTLCISISFMYSC